MWTEKDLKPSCGVATNFPGAETEKQLIFSMENWPVSPGAAAALSPTPLQRPTLYLLLSVFF